MGANLSETEAFGGAWIVSKEVRGKRIGTKLWEKRKEHVGDRNFGINSVASRVEPNLKLGYSVKSWKIGHISGIIDTTSLQISENVGFSIVPFHEELFERLVKYDTTIHSIERRKFLQVWLEKDSTLTLVATKPDADDIVGYGVIQKSDEGNFLGPVYGESGDILKVLLAKLINNASFGDKVDMFSPMENDMTNELLEKNKETLKQRYASSTRMYVHHDVKLPLSKVLALATVETALI
ncbi:uncharacterized protein LOC106171281 [Lingula anatina]|uniref:Uncharacterized protein LOC106171281 n=1 Tax=Lingula anatina TaxID=7574 RepID=A0A1S3J9M0_LINAN|nr:uncharacterized protein LOC106171281 [Lingula anatina]|eukprot:XP_013407018.1 uncharacterized protein LOC106171281 [Lingula anatina]